MSKEKNSLVDSEIVHTMMKKKVCAKKTRCQVLCNGLHNEIACGAWQLTGGVADTKNG